MGRPLTMSEVRARTGTPPATVHHYLRLGLLPAPHRVARNRFLYDDRHVQRLRLIRLLRHRRGLSLRAIAEVLPELVELERADAFRPEMWDRVVGRRLEADPGARARARLVEAAVEAFSRRGYAEVAVDELSRAAGLAKGSFYRHFSSKEELFFAAARAAADEVTAEVGRGLPSGSPATEAPSLARRLPLFLELWARAMHGRPGYARAAHDVVLALSAALGRDGPPDRIAGRAGPAVLGEALARAAAVLVTDLDPAETTAT
ncbi:MAG TPA: TetR family transcriptional regulator [Actinomycetota bacterium]|nr:TetR family transcriptional regulator [Actinomycetota bacterium]